MAKYKCSKCGTTASSKCAHSRHVFCDSRMEGLLSNLLKYEVIHEKAEVVTVQLSIKRWRDTGDSDTALLYEAIQLIREMSDEDARVYACGEHNWVLQSDTCELGCCTKGD